MKKHKLAMCGVCFYRLPGVIYRLGHEACYFLLSAHAYIVGEFMLIFIGYTGLA